MFVKNLALPLPERPSRAVVNVSLPAEPLPREAIPPKVAAAPAGAELILINAIDVDVARSASELIASKLKSVLPVPVLVMFTALPDGAEASALTSNNAPLVTKRLVKPAGPALP